MPRSDVYVSPMSGPIAEQFPVLAAWTLDGWVEIGPTDWSRSFIRVMNEGGLVWEGAEVYESVEDAFREAEAAIEAW